MTHRGCRPGLYPGIPLNMPAIIDVPSTSSQDGQSTQVKTRPKIPMYGPLEIRNYDQFLKEQKVLFHERYNQPCVKLNKMNEYQNLFILERGDFSQLIVARKNSEEYVLKIYMKRVLVENSLVEKLLEEKRILQSLDCPFTIRLECLYQDDVKLILIFAYIRGGELFTHLQRHKFDEASSKFYAGQVVLALEYLHNCDVVYRGLKPENILLDHLGNVKLIDFSHAKIVTTRTFTMCGTVEYVAPEMIAGKGYGQSVDWWAFGVLLFEMATGHPPFISHNPTATYKSITAGKFTMPTTFSKELHDLISKLLQPNVSKRIASKGKGSDEIKNHKFFKGTDWLKLLNRKVHPPFHPRYKSSLSYPSLAVPTDELLDLDKSKFEEHFKDF